jgi:hypothetical protein
MVSLRFDACAACSSKSGANQPARVVALNARGRDEL